MTHVISGMLPVAPTPFHSDGRVDEDGMRRGIDCLIDQGVDAICILANCSEQVVLSDDERATLMRLSFAHCAGRVPMTVMISHVSTDIVMARVRDAQEMGASMVMMMPEDLLADLDAGATGSMALGLLPAHIGPTLMHRRNGDMDAALAQWTKCLPLINHENRQCGLRACKAVYVKGGMIGSDFVRHRLKPISARIKDWLLGLAVDLDLIALRWGK
jgi:dihydrodipicolinate synthase/N-acetylneuraminate lyase